MSTDSPLRILFVAAEGAPFSKSGGLGEVVRDLPVALRRRGLDVRVLLPRHRGPLAGTVRRHPAPLGVPIGTGEHWCALLETTFPGTDVPVYLLEHEGFFGRDGIYGFFDDVERFAFLCRGALQACKALDWIPHVIHTHDWHTAAVPVYLNTVEWQGPLGEAASVFTIHNLGYQGRFDPSAFPVLGIGWEHFHQDNLEHYGQLNLMKGGITQATVITTVSPTYAREIQRPEYGFGLDGILRGRSADLAGVRNGIDEERWNPSTDPLIPATYDADNLGGKWVCKQRLQEISGLPENPYVPVIGVVSRLVGQKGLDVAADAAPYYLSMGAQLIVLGRGEGVIEERIAFWAAHAPQQVAFHRTFSEDLAHWIEAGSDFFLMPSRYEPCGLNQMYSQRYGTLPIARATGGLADTVTNLDMESGRGTGFLFHDLTVPAVGNTVRWALGVYAERPDVIRSMRRQAMARHFGWDEPAAAYEVLYDAAVERRRMLRGG